MQFELEILRQCWFLAGPTASGKSDVGVELADRLDAEIVSLDSMSLYRGMDIGTAKPSSQLRERVAHHLIDVIEPYEEYSVAEYVSAAQTACHEILARGKQPLFVGGTGLYLRAILRGVFDGPEADWDFRNQLEQEAADNEPGYLHQQLQLVDPQSATRLHPNDTRRLIRALEVHHVTGQPLSEQQQQAPLPVSQRPDHVYWLAPPREWLYERINRRVEGMVEAELIGEIQRLLSVPAPLSRTARQALGYKEFIDELERSETRNLNDAQIQACIELIQTRTRQFAKRQHTWFRNLTECSPIEMTDNDSPCELAERLFALRED